MTTMPENKIKQIEEKNLISDKLSNFDAEIAIIGCILWDNKTYEKIADFLHEDHFTDINNKKIFAVIKKLLDQNILVSPITLKNYLEENEDENIDNYKYLNQIKDSAPSVENTYQFAKLIYDLHIKRSLIGIGNRIIQDTISDKDLLGNDLIENAENDLYNLSQTGSSERKHKYFSEALKDAVNIIDQSFKREGKIAGIPTGLKDLDKKLGGLHNSDLIIIAGRPSMGKTALGTNIAFNAAKKFKESVDDFDNKITIDGGKVAFFSLEMSAEQLATRILAEQSKISSDKMRKVVELTKDDFKKIAKVSSELENLNLYIDDNPILTIPALRARARRLKRLYDINLIVIDYLQLMSGSSNVRNDGRVQEISEITRGLKAIAKELNIPVIALSQLSRQVEQREDKRPLLSDLRESGTIEQDSDVVMFIYRESYYLERMEPIKKVDELEDKYTERHQRWRELCESSYNTAEFIIAKQRHGPIGTIKAHFDSNFTKFSDISNQEYDNIIE
ncbi:MAG: Replicative DNA helicase [Alphaproteobacteria bacterium MarineAlpha5_Bin8]|nr:MAG: Replicative DNA helicase [Alphaproteobacteria bacterium MarineAlpha5_Bin7]PPR46431.1 MAG: Replicative DNA helicase [Alphaproteobacteria bacterium MarineAlpha5_Bin8]PPR53333.1 MAG: Replicative DNA helicase [Alphaproteobacteria bacterium MarineAlpha5_Bin6]|tara:strand:- start:16242 stop:17756 length:1515 start_codon:yes stop_codon:yes gene_type:complete